MILFPSFKWNNLGYFPLPCHIITLGTFAADYIFLSPFGCFPLPVCYSVHFLHLHPTLTITFISQCDVEILFPSLSDLLVHVTLQSCSHYYLIHQ